MSDAFVIGGGPTGLMAAQELLARGHSVVLAEQMPTVGRKFLMAGKSGLNLTKSEPLEKFLGNYRHGRAFLTPAVRAFGPQAVAEWSQGLGQPTFVGSTGRVFPKAMKASPLLRAWLAQLQRGGLDIRTRWRWTGWQGDQLRFETPQGGCLAAPKAVVLAVGGASWRRLGSDGSWARWMGDQVAPFAPSNVGLRVTWSPHMSRYFGAPVKGTALSCGDQTTRGEFVVTAGGLEGGGVYEISAGLREGATLRLDLFPDASVETLRSKLARIATKDSLSNRLRKTLKLTGVRLALLNEFARPLPEDLAPLLKSIRVPIAGFDDLERAISTVGGVRRDCLSDELMLNSTPGVFCAGEMIDWDAPTGGYLLTASLATGRWAGRAAGDYLDQF